MLLSHRSCCRRLAPLLQASWVLGLLVSAELPAKPELGELSHNGTVDLSFEQPSRHQLEDETVLLQKFADVADRRERGLNGQQERAIEHAMLELNAALHNGQGNELTQNQFTSQEDGLVSETDLLPDQPRRAELESQHQDGGAAAEQTGINAFTPAHESDSPLNLLLYNEIVFEVSRHVDDDDEVVKKSKIALALLEGFFFPALCGVDRCYMGQPILGVLKGLSFGGCMVWYFIDFIAIFINMCQQKEQIDTLGFVARFGNDQVSTALIIMICFLVVHCCAGGGCVGGGVKTVFLFNATPVRGTDEVIEVDKHQEIRCNYKTVTGTEGIIFGDHNHIEGGWHQVVGNCNVVEGKGCYVKGDANLVNGISNQVEGKGNDVNGMSNVVSGAHNKVSGANPRCTETEPFKQDIYDNYQAARVVDRRQDHAEETPAGFKTTMKT
mmetsp:Transcript_107001/g.189501  ORF Transcript_107001/g.189501 Transcript_107001/m.189501 type:complete len:440 (-) Transcript_107001:179-1498(-)